ELLLESLTPAGEEAEIPRPTGGGFERGRVPFAPILCELNARAEEVDEVDPDRLAGALHDLLGPVEGCEGAGKILQRLEATRHVEASPQQAVGDLPSLAQLPGPAGELHGGRQVVVLPLDLGEDAVRHGRAGRIPAAVLLGPTQRPAGEVGRLAQPAAGD